MNQAREHRAELASLAKALKEATESLWHANGQLLHAREAADEARRLKAQFAANVSHELHPTINLVIRWQEVMVMTPKSTAHPFRPRTVGTFIRFIATPTTYETLINDILDISPDRGISLSHVKREDGSALYPPTKRQDRE
ncbi:MAG: hypothetical protein IPK19_20685 [Chloroflexi bacterium]|nr:hypothetical protein [Chloroflexota bacterium]